MKITSVIGVYHALRMVPLMEHRIPNFEMALVINLEGLLIYNVMPTDNEIAQRINGASMEQSGTRDVPDDGASPDVACAQCGGCSKFLLPFCLGDLISSNLYSLFVHSHVFTSISPARHT